MSFAFLKNLLAWISLAGVLCATSASAAEGDKPRVVAIVSLIGDQMRVVGDQATTGSRVSRSAPESVALPFDVLELSSLKAATQALLRVDATATAAPLKITDAAIYNAQAEFLSGDRAALPAAIVDPLKSTAVTHLLLISRHRDDVRMDTGRQQLGSGKIEGVGYYVDRETKLFRVGTGDVDVGYLAPYVYIRVSLIELATKKVLASRVSTQGKVITATSANARGDPWGFLDSAGKLKRLQDMVASEVEIQVESVLAGR
jgi:hypothetical protein